MKIRKYRLNGFVIVGPLGGLRDMRLYLRRCDAERCTNDNERAVPASAVFTVPEPERAKGEREAAMKPGPETKT